MSIGSGVIIGLLGDIGTLSLKVITDLFLGKTFKENLTNQILLAGNQFVLMGMLRSFEVLVEIQYELPCLWKSVDSLFKELSEKN